MHTNVVDIFLAAGAERVKDLSNTPFANIQIARNIDVSQSMSPLPPPGSINTLSGFTFETEQYSTDWYYGILRAINGSWEQQVLNFSFNDLTGHYILDEHVNNWGYKHFVSGIHKSGPPNGNLPWMQTLPVGDPQIVRTQLKPLIYVLKFAFDNG